MRWPRWREPQIKIRLVRDDDGRQGTEVSVDGKIVAQLAPNGIWFYAHNVTVETSGPPLPPKPVEMPAPSDVPRATPSGTRAKKASGGGQANPRSRRTATRRNSPPEKP